MNALIPYYHRYLALMKRRLGLEPRVAAFLLSIAVIAGVTAGAWIAATVIRVTIFDAREAVDVDQSLACSGKDTPFADMTDFEVIRQYYQLQVFNMLNEQEKIVLETAGQCNAIDAAGFLPTSSLNGFAQTLPGWRGDITFASFEPVLLEFARAYECKLQELIANARVTVLEGDDLPDEEPPETYDQVESRVNTYVQKLEEEKTQSRVAFDRTMNTIRSFQMSAPIIKELKCLQLESIDLRNAMSLLSDASSCMPRIWDAVTSLHERAPEEE